jgi:peptidase M30-like protein/fibronectin type III domain protein
MYRTTRAAAVAAAALVTIFILAGCGVGNEFPILEETQITVTAATNTSITISWIPAANEPSVGRGYQYEVYAAASPLTSANDLSDLTPHISATASELGEDVAVATISGLSAGTGYHINVAAVNTRSGDLELYDNIIGITTGGTIVSDVYTGSVPYFNHSADGTGASTAIEYTIDLGVGPADVYLVFSNPADAAVSRPEVMLGSLSEVGPLAWSGTIAPAAQSLPSVTRSATPAGPVILRDNPAIADWEAPTLGPAGRGVAPPPPPPSYDTAGVSTAVFHDDSTTTIEATCRAVVTNGTTTLNVWVEDTEWSSLPAAPNGKIDQTMVNFLADSFLAADPNNDIFDWLTNIYGDEWGPHSKLNLITNNDEITILLWNIGNDGDGGVVGYFWAKDNYLASGQGGVYYSNERIMFYLDSESLGTREGQIWDTTDFWPTEMVATLAHEFQHMIHYYQRDILLDTSTTTWVNEMMSMVSEDLVGNELYTEQGLDIAGPRGVYPSQGGDAGPLGNDLGRIPLFNGYPSISLSTWLSGNDVLKSYSIAYAFGAFLSRNFGGAPLFESMMDSDESDTELMIQEAIAAAGGPAGLIMGDLLWKWGVAVLLSDSTTAPAGYRMNSGTWMSSSVTTTYDLGSVDHFRYDREEWPGDGPQIHSASSYSLTEMKSLSTAYYKLAEDQTGLLTAVLLVPNGTDYTVVVK